jgi:hypothetical protein
MEMGSKLLSDQLGREFIKKVIFGVENCQNSGMKKTDGS